ncbi:MAG: hypothetical protein WDN45_14260 [Caulobacteraceae bacterium]
MLMTASGASDQHAGADRAAVGDGHKWYQIYMPADRGETAELDAAGQGGRLHRRGLHHRRPWGAGNSEELQRTGFNNGRALGAAAARVTAGAPGAGIKRGPQKRSFDWGRRRLSAEDQRAAGAAQGACCRRPWQARRSNAAWPESRCPTTAGVSSTPCRRPSTCSAPSPMR